MADRKKFCTMQGFGTPVSAACHVKENNLLCIKIEKRHFVNILLQMRSLKVVLLHDGNRYASIPIAQNYWVVPEVIANFTYGCLWPSFKWLLSMPCFFPSGICQLSLLVCFPNKLHVISFTVFNWISTLRQSVKTSIFVIFCFFISVEERTQHMLLKSYVMCMVRKPYKTDSVEIGLINSVLGIFHLNMCNVQIGQMKLMMTKSKP